MRCEALIVGAGPAGLACAIEAKKRKIKYRLLDQGGLVDAIFRFPADMTFFSTPDLLSIGDTIFVSENFRPTRIETLNYYRAVAKRYALIEDFAPYHKVEKITKNGDLFHVAGSTPSGAFELQTPKLVLATGYYDNPNMLNTPGEELPKTSHYFTEAHRYLGSKVAVIGGKNSAVDAAMALQRTGVETTLIHRGEKLSDSVKYWIRPDIEKMIERGKINAKFRSVVETIKNDSIVIKSLDDASTEEIENDFVFAMTGYRPNFELLDGIGLNVDPDRLVPEHDPKSMETNAKNLHVAGSIAAGLDNNKIFIENSRGHGALIF